MSSAPPVPPVQPDTKDWTWVLTRPCHECGFVASETARDGFGEAIRANAGAFVLALRQPGATSRPAPDVWSVAEYACHVRDVHTIFDERVRAMRDQDEPVFANWDQDVTAVEQRYDLQDPVVVAPALLAAADQVASTYDAVPDDAWERRGLRSNGSEFTIDSIARYHLHDVVHHLNDIASAVTVAAYDAAAADYREQSNVVAPELERAVDAFAALLPARARVLEIGSGSGRDARTLEARGLSVRRTDVTPAFVAALRAEGTDADLLDPLVDDLADPAHPTDGTPYHAVWANACLLHVARRHLPVVLVRLAAVTKVGGPIRVSLKEGDGDGWSTHGSVTTPRHFVYWREQPLREVVGASGWSVDEVVHTDGRRGERWLNLVATRTGRGVHT